MTMFACENCGKVLDLPPSRIRCGRRYCTRECKNASVRTRPTPGRVGVACLQCGETFLVPRSWVKEGRRKFCNRTCRNRHLRTLTGESAPRYGKKHRPESRNMMSANRTAVAQRRENHPGWKGGRCKTGEYVSVMIDLLPEGQRALAREMCPKKTYIMEHRLVKAVAMGRPLGNKEHVHHDNGIKTDNRPENLTLETVVGHSRKHREVHREVARLREENARLKSLLATYQVDGSATSSPPEKI
jgi:hypothetical protein